MRILKLLPIMLLVAGHGILAEKVIVESGIIFKDVSAEYGLKNVGNQKATWADLNGDGYPDLVTDGQIWKNQSGKRFTNVTADSGIKPPRGGSSVVADFNGDGILDIYFTGKGGMLCLGKDNFKFVDGNTFKHDSVTMAACAVDLDNDGYVDLYIANYEIWKKKIGFRDLILRNDKGKMVKQWEAPDEKLMRGRGATACDFNNDGKMDIYVSNYRLMPNFLWVNNGNWELVDEARKLGCAGSENKKVVFKNCLGIKYYSSGHTIGSLWADFDNDTYFDLFVGNFSHPPKFQDRPQLLRNSGPSGNYRFTDKSSIAKIPWQESYGTPAAGDFDNDGLIDIFFNTCYSKDNGRLLRNLGNWKFKDITASSGVLSRVSYQNALADFDNDGRLDMINNGRLYRNVSANNNWITINLRGKAPNTSAIGAKVILDCDGKKQIRQVEAGTGSGNQNDLRLHFGLGTFNNSINIKIIWPDGKVDEKLALPNSHQSYQY